MRHGELKHIFDTLERCFDELRIDYYLIDALARQIWYEKEGVNFRTTKDVDYAVLMSSREEYQTVRQYLIDRENFTAYKGDAFVLISPDGIQVDILPFGEIETDEEVIFSGQGMTNIKVDGMKEVYHYGTASVTLETGNSFRVATLSAIALLKFIAYDDRPDQRQKDVVDIANIARHFFNLHEELIYEQHNDLFDEEKVASFDSIGPIVLGREMKKIAEHSPKLRERLNKIMENHLQMKEKSIFLRLILQTMSEEADLQTAHRLLSDIRGGFCSAIL
ncbi:nucleotidyl transferase AbiEii/AbiGii toxin family protein [Sphingobacterium pedocola]|uniref:Nucleotidyltransferase n=1 Tax=Sphingobacterium pedocola TaxID=2082722 RepID=A0ABR9T886_9SPHI|nr:nucleotidyl transferase AbiEii/AbiGii toxin family protein [Sphingobacterium pedocola]MBE8721560.1 hypothetical protein [Sphingobacterium pedocola]